MYAVSVDRPTRAAALGALASTVLLTACGPVRAVRERIRGCPDADVPSQLHLTVVADTFRSRHVRGPVGYALAYPDWIDPRSIDGAIYLLPGRGGAARSTVDDLGFGAHFSRSKFEGKGRRPSVLIAVDAGESYFHRRASGEDRLAMVMEELPEIVARRTGARPRREALIGVSMGGYGALLAYARAPSRYRAVAVAGPALFTSYADERAGVGDAFDDARDFAANDAGAACAARANVYVRCGESDPFAPAVRAFLRRCPHAEADIVPGCHTDGFWRASAPHLLGFAQRFLNGASARTL